MKRIKKLTLGGIQSKVFLLILITVSLLTTAFLAVSSSHSGMLARLASETRGRQQDSIAGITSAVMDNVVSETLEHANWTEARLADELFEAVRNRVTFLGDYAAKLFAHPEDWAPMPCDVPEMGDDGVWKVKVIYADGVDPADPAISSKVGLLANMSDMLISLCKSFEAANVYIALPEGAHLSASNNSSSWFVDGRLRSYDPRERGWYQKAVEAGGPIFTDGNRDANTGAYCIECAVPVYGPDGALEAVIGTDLYLDEMQSVMQQASREGGYTLLVNQSGRAVLEPQVEAFPMDEADKSGDLRDSGLEQLSRAVGDALGGKTVSAMLGQLRDGAYYITATPIRTTGWVLVSAYSQAIAGKPAATLQESSKLIQAEVAATYRTRTKRFRIAAIVILLLLAALTLAGALILGGRIVRPLNTITQRISELNDDNIEFKMEDAYRTGDEVQALAQSFADLSHKTMAYMDRLVKVTTEKERIGAEMALASRIQSTMLPHTFPPFPDRREFDIFASMDPAKEVGGDFYDFFLIDDDHLCVVMADVSGKGVPAALFMMAAKIILKDVAMMGSSPADILQTTNETLCSNNEAKMFVTVWLGVLEISTGKLTASNGGHEYPALKRPDGAFEIYRDKHGFVLGGIMGAKYTEYEIQLEPGTKLFVYTDGVPEANAADGQMFGMQRMLDALNAAPDAAPEAILRGITASVDAFVKDAEQFDDLTMLCVEYRGAGA